MSYSVVIPSRDINNLRPCIQALLANEPELPPRKIVVVDDGLPLSEVPAGVTVVEGWKPFIFARNCNIGVEHVDGSDDLVLMNDDALLKTPNGLTQMVKASAGWGIVSAVTNRVGNPNQRRTGAAECSEPREERRRTLAFICVCIPRIVWYAVGKLDERYTAYGWEDDDQCRRVTLAGFRLGIFDGCFVDHNTLSSTFAASGKSSPDELMRGRMTFLEKWGTEEY